MTEETVPVKRPRGRPKKVVASPAAAVKPAVAANTPGEGGGKRAARETITPKKARAEPPQRVSGSDEEDIISADEDGESTNSSFNTPVAVAVPAKKRGAPPPEPEDPVSTPPKRGRGRPPKKNKKKGAGASPASAGSAAVAGKSPGTTPRGRGRPRKNPL